MSHLNQAQIRPIEIQPAPPVAPKEDHKGGTKTVDILIIGGGPAALGMLVNAVKTNRLNELIQGDGIAIIDAGLSLGGGQLSHYGINSNTSGGGFLKCTYKKHQQTFSVPQKENQNSKKKQGAGDKKQKSKKNQQEQQQANPYLQNTQQKGEQPQVNGQKQWVQKDELEILAPYKELYTSNICKELKKFAKNTAPLSLIGHLLNYAGNHLLSNIHQNTKKKIFYPLHQATSIQLMQNGEIRTKVKQYDCSIKQTDEGNVIEYHEQEQVTSFRSKVVIIANGGVQGLHPELFQWFPNLNPQITLASDAFLRKEVYCSTMKQIKEQQMKKIVIIGGSHSGFSCAWMLLNGPAMYYKNNAGISIDKEPTAHRKYIKNCIDCCHCGLQLQNQKKQAKSNQVNNQFSPVGKQSNQQLLQCSCVCKCFGYFNYDDWQFNYEEDIPEYEEGSIEILYRDKIRVFYNKVSDAENDGYNEFQEDQFTKKDGYLYSFTGLRGDAKDLYLRIMRGEEKRVKLIQAKDESEQKPYVESADLVLWSCGYQTSVIPIRDVDKRKLELSQKVPNTQFDVDGKCRIMLADGQVLAKVFACGIAYPVRTKDGMMVNNPTMQNPRADSFSLYMNYVGDMLLRNIIPKQRTLKNTIHKIKPQPKQPINPTTQGSALSKKQFQQVANVRARNHQSNGQQVQKDGLTVQIKDEQINQRHKSVNVREPQNNFDRKSQLINPNQDLNGIKATKQYDIVDKIDEMVSPIQNKELLPSKSVDRAHQPGTFQNKLATINRSPQILQKKQQIMKLKNQNQEMLKQQQLNNQGIMPLLQDGVYYQVKGQQTKNKNPIQQQVYKTLGKSPYVQKMITFDKPSSQYSQAPSSRQGRELRSSHAQRSNGQVKNNHSVYELNRSSQASFKQKQNMNRASIQGAPNNSNLYFHYSMGGLGPQQLMPLNAKGQTEREQNQKQRTKFPPIVQPKAGKKPFSDQKQRLKSNPYQVTEHENTGEDIQEDIGDDDFNMRDNEYEEHTTEVFEESNCNNAHPSKQLYYQQYDTSESQKQGNFQNVKINHKIHQGSPDSIQYQDEVFEDAGSENYSPDLKPTKCLILDRDSLSDNEEEDSDSPYEEENFEAEEDPLKEDVSSEGSCRFSQVHGASMTLKGEIFDDEENVEDNFDEDHNRDYSQAKQYVPSVTEVNKEASQVVTNSNLAKYMTQSRASIDNSLTSDQQSFPKFKQQNQKDIESSKQETSKIKPYAKISLDVNKFTQGHLSPVLAKRNQPKQNAVSSQKDQQSDRTIVQDSSQDKQALQNSLKKRRYLNENIVNDHVIDLKDHSNDTISLRTDLVKTQKQGNKMSTIEQRHLAHHSTSSVIRANWGSNNGKKSQVNNKSQTILTTTQKAKDLKTMQPTPVLIKQKV